MSENLPQTTKATQSGLPPDGSKDTSTDSTPINDPVNPTHYSKYGKYSPVDVIETFKLPYHLASALAYIIRHRDKGGLIDLKKAHWYLQRFEVYTGTHLIERVPIKNYYGNFLGGIEGEQELFLQQACTVWNLPYDLEVVCTEICLENNVAWMRAKLFSYIEKEEAQLNANDTNP